MARLPIFTETADGQLMPMRPSAPPDEDSLQDLIGRFPEVISGDGEPLLLVRREQTVPDTMDGASRWSLDHLFISRNAIPVLVEVKRATDSRIRREVIGQLMDYAANGVAYWQPGSLAEAFEKHCQSEGLDCDIAIAQFLGDEDPQDFWNQVDANLAAGRIRLIIATDAIPKELARIVEFLNEQMRCTVLAVELTYFESEDGRRTLAPKIIGETERTELSKRKNRPIPDPISVEDWLEKHIAGKGDPTLQGTHHLINLVRGMDGNVTVSEQQGSILANWNIGNGAVTWPFVLGKNGRLGISFGWIKSRPALRDEATRGEFLQRMHEAVGGLSTSNANGHPTFPIERLSDPIMAKAFDECARELVGLALAAKE
ncbi:hypothetical protein RYZ27_01460 [Hyphomonas sp. FCG-A18]|uniref:hypothetical protein n=1 Tax=Hyphomonas sp. FCG-A18 TaxID=3080019 RepID=UPI002B2F2F83|nr:hypothetical protein RYZ27_01460 [Hyphomonas sp. FCG-A18]